MHDIKGPNNVIADTFLWLERINDSLSLEGKNAPLEMPCVFEQSCKIDQDTQMLECFLNLLCLNEPVNNPLNYEYLAKQQFEDKKL